MRHFGWIVVAGALCAASSAYAQSITGGTGATTRTDGLTTRTFTRTIGGVQRKETYVFVDRNKDADSRRRSKDNYLPRCRRGLFGRVDNAPCRQRRRYGGVQNGQTY